MLFKTRSICPECFAVIDAAHVLDLDSVYLVKTCDVHGVFKTKIWQGEETYKHWIKPKIPIVRRFGQMLTKKGCPFDCGLCPDHRQHTCTAVLEVTHNCNCHCDFCFAGSGSARTISDPSLEHIANLLTLVYKTSSGCNLQIS
ncbi:MAG: radical SAM protein, partial [Proteobacteria bacterium]|nr:radical SAM protein [Pseudomonadota bacterium]